MFGDFFCLGFAGLLAFVPFFFSSKSHYFYGHYNVQALIWVCSVEGREKTYLQRILRSMFLHFPV